MAASPPRSRAGRRAGTGQPFDLKIERLVAGGRGLGRGPDGRVVLVPLVLPDEAVRVQPIASRRDYTEARLLSILSPSPLRVSPPCPLFGRCGGCDLQHAAPAAQADLKTAILTDAWQHILGRSTGELAGVLAPPVPAPDPLGYRLRLRLHTDAAGRLGMRRALSHTLAPVRHCPVATPPVNDLLAVWADCGPARQLARRAATVEVAAGWPPGEAFVIARLAGAAGSRERQLARAAGAALPGCAAVAVLARDQDSGWSTDPAARLRIRLPVGPGGPDLALAVAPGSFYQVNGRQNEALVACVLALAQAAPGRRILDLFCGMGNLSLPLARAGAQVLGLDQAASAIHAALANAEAGGLAGRARFETAEAAAGLARLQAAGRCFDLVLLDPPRGGCPEVAQLLARSPCPAALVVSCDPVTLMRDLSTLLAAGYALDRLQPLDMFPQTHHLETVALLHWAGPPAAAA
ncbi:MAG: class I SAM-dependent RNA methyltransferase [Thermodesulfobacteriota bacterium]